MESWTSIEDLGGCIDAIYLDFAKGFDTVPHQQFIKKLTAYGAQGEVSRWIEAFVTGKRQSISKWSPSEWSEVTSVLGLILFIIVCLYIYIYINVCMYA